MKVEIYCGSNIVLEPNAEDLDCFPMLGEKIVVRQVDNTHYTVREIIHEFDLNGDLTKLNIFAE